MAEPTVTIPLADYVRLLRAAESDDALYWCDTCGAWIDCNDPALAVGDDYTGCRKAGSDRTDADHLCRSYRATVAEQPARPAGEDG